MRPAPAPKTASEEKTTSSRFNPPTPTAWPSRTVAEPLSAVDFRFGRHVDAVWTQFEISSELELLNLKVKCFI